MFWLELCFQDHVRVARGNIFHCDAFKYFWISGELLDHWSIVDRTLLKVSQHNQESHQSGLFLMINKVGHLPSKQSPNVQTIERAGLMMVITMITPDHTPDSGHWSLICVTLLIVLLKYFCNILPDWSWHGGGENEVIAHCCLFSLLPCNWWCQCNNCFSRRMLTPMILL